MGMRHELAEIARKATPNGAAGHNPRAGKREGRDGARGGSPWLCNELLIYHQQLAAALSSKLAPEGN